MTLDDIFIKAILMPINKAINYLITDVTQRCLQTLQVTAIKLRYCRACYPLSPTPPPEGGGAFLPSPLQGEGMGERVFRLNLMAVTLQVGTS